MKIKFISNLLHKKNKGQTLIEAVVTLAIALVIIASVVTLANSSNRRANQARQATQASKLAQEGMEIIRNIRDVNSDEAVRVESSALCSTASPCSWNNLYDNLQGDLSAFLQRPGDCGITESWCVVGTQPAGENTLLDVFSRSIVISDTDLVPGGEICTESPSNLDFEDVKRIRVTVSWQSPIGAQEREVISCIANI